MIWKSPVFYNGYRRLEGNKTNATAPKIGLKATIFLISDEYGIDYLPFLVTVTVFPPITDIGNHDLQFTVMNHLLLHQSEWHDLCACKCTVIMSITHPSLTLSVNCCALYWDNAKVLWKNIGWHFSSLIVKTQSSKKLSEPKAWESWRKLHKITP